MKTCRYLRGRQAEFCSKSKAASVNAFAAFLSPSLWITCDCGSPRVLIKIKSSSNLSSLGSSISCRLGLGCHHSLHFPGEANILDLNSDRERKCAFYLSIYPPEDMDSPFVGRPLQIGGQLLGDLLPGSRC